ncbi:MAG: glycosyltransferase family 2 protein [Calditrichaeota bacterium]|nr:MAG: glycosyltransferase family 2 protein [Calditrichota bacterium]
MSAMEWVFWVCVCCLLYVYVGYPLVLALWARWFPRPVTPDPDYLPPVSLIIAAYNEEAVIEEKLRNALSLDYPRDRLEIIVASDGSEDCTNQIVEQFADEGVRLNAIFPRGGKTRALNLTIPTASHPIIVLSDANTMYQRDSIRQLVQYLKDPRVGSVTGDVKILNDSPEFGESEGAYYRYERFIQECESRIGSIIGVDGAMYAFKRDLFIPPSDEIILDDFVTSMNIVRQGYRVLYNRHALAYENATPTIGQEIRRKSRIAAGGMQALLKGEGLPARGQWRDWFMYLSHKLLRWFTPFFLIGALLSSALSSASPLYLLAFWGQGIFYLLAALGWALSSRKLPAFLKLPFYFCMINYAVLLGVIKGLLGLQKVTWKKADRELVALPNQKTTGL